MSDSLVVPNHAVYTLALSAFKRIGRAEEILHQAREDSRQDTTLFRNLFEGILQALSTTKSWVIPLPDRVRRFSGMSYCARTEQLIWDARNKESDLRLADVVGFSVEDNVATVAFTARIVGMPYSRWNKNGDCLRMSLPSDLLYDPVSFDAYMDQSLRRIEREDRKVAEESEFRKRTQERHADLGQLRSLISRYPAIAKNIINRLPEDEVPHVEE